MRRWSFPEMTPILLLYLAAGLTDLSTDFARIATAIPGRIGAAAVILETGERAAIRGSERFPMQSVYKFPIAMAVLHEVDSGNLKLDQSIRIERRELVPPALHSPIRDRYPDGGSLPLREILR